MSSSAIPHALPSQVLSRRIRTRAIEWALLLAGCALLAGMLPRAWNHVETDFPNYYVTAHLVREGYATDRLYEWEWFARQKDRVEMEQSLAAFIPHTPLSGLVLVPLANLEPLTAKRAWIVLNLAMLMVSLLMLAALAGVHWQWLAIAALFSFPVYRNLDYGQMYILLLLLLACGLWSYLRGHKAAAGLFLAVAAALKIFPVLFLFYFLRKRDWRAAASFVAGSAGLVALCFAVFPARMLTTFVTSIFPAAIRGEGNDPFNLTASSISALLHHLLIYQPELNPHPLVNAPVAMAILQPSLQFGLLAVALLPCRAGSTPARLRLEWAALLTAGLAASTMPASYHFVLLLLPLAVWLRHFMKRKLWRPALTLAVLVFLAGWPKWPLPAVATPRLWCVLLLFALFCMYLWRQEQRIFQDGLPWLSAIACLAALSIASTIFHVRSAYAAEASVIPARSDIYAAMYPMFDCAGLQFTAMTPQGWRLASMNKDGNVRIEAADTDELSQSCYGSLRLVERVGKTSSIQWADGDGSILVRDGESPVVGSDRRLAFLRRTRGRASLWTHDLQSGAESQITNDSYDVYEVAADGVGGFVFSATTPGTNVSLYDANPEGRVVPLGVTNSRYPAISADGRWLAYSQWNSGHWNLTIASMTTHKVVFATHTDCNDLGAAWAPDAMSLIVASDCGRGLWEPTLRRRRFLP